MNEIVLNLIVIGSLALVGGVIFLAVRSGQKGREQALHQLVESRGWQLQPIRERLASGMRISGPGWELESISRSSDTEAGPGSSNIQSTTTFSAPRPGSALLFGPVQGRTDLGHFGDMLMRRVLQEALGSEANGLQQVLLQDAELSKRCMVMALDPREVERVLTPAVRTRLAAMHPLPVIKRTSKGLSVELTGEALKRPEEVADFIDLGEALLG